MLRSFHLRKTFCEFEEDFEVPPHTKVRVAATEDKKLCREMQLIHEQELKRANDEDRAEPDQSNTIEMLLRKGVKAYGQCSLRGRS
jgi:hypothetical protein